MNIDGKLVKILQQETGVSKAGKEWKKQSIILEQDTEYNLSCNVNISSREFNGKYYHNIDGWACSISSNKLSESSEELTNDDLPF